MPETSVPAFSVVPLKKRFLSLPEALVARLLFRCATLRPTHRHILRWLNRKDHRWSLVPAKVDWQSSRGDPRRRFQRCSFDSEKSDRDRVGGIDARPVPRGIVKADARNAIERAEFLEDRARAGCRWEKGTRRQFVTPDVSLERRRRNVPTS